MRSLSIASTLGILLQAKRGEEVVGSVAVFVAMSIVGEAEVETEVEAEVEAEIEAEVLIESIVYLKR